MSSSDWLCGEGGGAQQLCQMFLLGAAVPFVALSGSLLAGCAGSKQVKKRSKKSVKSVKRGANSGKSAKSGAKRSKSVKSVKSGKKGVKSSKRGKSASSKRSRSSKRASSRKGKRSGDQLKTAKAAAKSDKLRTAREQTAPFTRSSKQRRSSRKSSRRANPSTDLRTATSGASLQSSAKSKAHDAKHTLAEKASGAKQRVSEAAESAKNMAQRVGDSLTKESGTKTAILDESSKALSGKSADGEAQPLLKFDPPVLRFCPQQQASYTLTMQNTNGVRVAVKAKCTDNAIFRVHPVYTFIEAGEQLNVVVTRIAAPFKVDKLVFVSTKASALDNNPSTLFGKPDGGQYSMAAVPLFTKKNNWHCESQPSDLRTAALQKA